MNQESSRSHALFTIIVEHSTKDEATGDTCVTIGRLNLVDLAGSERIRHTGNESGARLDELKNINQSLTTFGKVILALTSPGNLHVPYRDSKCVASLSPPVTATARRSPLAVQQALSLCWTPPPCEAVATPDAGVMSLTPASRLLQADADHARQLGRELQDDDDHHRHRV